MKPFLVALIVIPLLVVGQASCSRKKNSNADTNLAAVSDGTAEGQRTQARSLVDQGKELYRNDEDDKAVEVFKEAIKLDPELAEAYFRLGLAYDATCHGAGGGRRLQEINRVV